MGYFKCVRIMFNRIWPGAKARGRQPSCMRMEAHPSLKELEFNDGRFPREALAEAIENCRAVLPELLKVLKQARQNARRLMGQEKAYMAHIYAMYLLASSREKSAYSPIVDFYSLPGETSLELSGDVVTEGLGRILASVSCGDPRLMKRLVENAKANEYVRSAALKGLTILAVLGEQPRTEIMGYFQSLFRKRLERKPSHVWDNLVCCSLDLYPEEVYQEIQRAYEEEFISPGYVTFEEVQERMGLGLEKTLGRLKNDRKYSLIGNPIQEMEWWACFDQS